MAEINLTKAVRSNLLSLQSTAAQMAKTQERLATGLKVNSALDNPTNFFTASSLTSRASDMGNLLDSMMNGISVIQAADNGIKSITKTVESMQSTLRQARQDKSFKTESYTIDLGATPAGTEEVSFSGGAVGTTPVAVNLTSATSTLTGGAFTAVDFENGGANDGSISFGISVNGQDTPSAIQISYADALAGAADAGAVTADELAAIINEKIAQFDDLGVTANADGGTINFVSTRASTPDADVTVSSFTVSNGATGSGIANGSGTVGDYAAKTVDELVAEINKNASLEGKIRAANDSGKLRIENQSLAELEVEGVSGTTINGGAGTDEIGGNTVRKSLVEQFNNLRDQLDKFADDASFNGINLLRGDKLKLTFNETGTSTIEIQARDENGDATSINNFELGITNAQNADFDSDTSLDARLDVLASALGTLRAHASNFGSNLSIVENRQNFTKNMINTLETGAANLTLADTNEEAANLLALQTRQQLSSTALSMASQADQAVLRLF